MNDLVFFSLVLMLFIRIIGLGTSLNFLYDLRKKSYYYLVLGWIFGIIGNIMPLIVDYVEINILAEFILILNAFFVSLSVIFLSNGVFLDILRIKFLYLLLGCIIITLIAILLFFFINYTISIEFLVVVLNLTILIAFITPIIKLKQFREIFGQSIRWYYVTCGILIAFLPVSFYISIQGYGYGLYNTDDILFIILNYTIGIITHIVLIVFIIHLEYSSSNKRQNHLKDMYSHNLGNIMQVIYSSADLFKIVAKKESDEIDHLDLIQSKCREASKLIKEIRNI
jgi:hypothetical protein